VGAVEKKKKSRQKAQPLTYLGLQASGPYNEEGNEMMRSSERNDLIEYDESYGGDLLTRVYSRFRVRIEEVTESEKKSSHLSSIQRLVGGGTCKQVIDINIQTHRYFVRIVDNWWAILGPKSAVDLEEETSYRLQLLSTSTGETRRSNVPRNIPYGDGETPTPIEKWE
jgi:hypothetical protein